MTQIRSTGWQLTLNHPTTGRTISPDVLDDPEFLPSLNNLVEARIPVRRSEDLLQWPSGTTVSLRLNGDEQPLDEVVDFEQQSDRTIVVCEGGAELDERVRTEYQEERRHVAAEEIINNNTTYSPDVDTPVFDTLNDEIIQSADSTTEFNDLLSLPSTSPITVTNGSVETYQSAFVFEAEDDNALIQNDVAYSDGVAARIENVAGGSSGVSFTFTTEYDIENPELIVRGERSTADPADSLLVDLTIDSTTVQQDYQPDDTLGWDRISVGQTVTAGSHTISLEFSTFLDNDNPQYIDLFGFLDADFNYTFDNTVHQDNGYLDGPEEHPDAADVVFDDATTAFIITEATGDIAIDDTSNEQAVALSADLGQTFTEATNSTSVTATGLDTPQVRLRVTLSRHSPQGARDQTPRFGYASQSLDSFEITADLRLESLLIDQTFDDSVQSVLNQIAGDEYIWSYRLENGTPTIAWTQPGQRTADSDPDIDANVSVSKSVKTWDAVTIKGSAQSVSGEEFSGSTSFVDLARDNIVPGSEAVRGTSNGTQFQRGIDYEMQYNPGEIRILETGDMQAGTIYEIDYRYEVEGTYPENYSGTNELVETISGVVSDRQAQQLAYVILEVDPGVADESWSANVLLPRTGTLFDPLEALSLEQLNLPDAATPLEIREPPQQTPQGIALQLGSRRGLDEALSTLSNQLRTVSRRS